MTRTIRLEHVLKDNTKDLAFGLDAWRTDWSDLVADRAFFGIDMDDDVWRFPDALFRRKTTDALRRIDFCRVLPEAWLRNDTRSETLLRRVKRMVRVLAVSGLSSTRKTSAKGTSSVSRAMGALTLVTTAQDLLSAVKALVEEGLIDFTRSDDCPDGGPIFSHLDEADFKIAWEAGGKHFRAAFNRLCDVRDRGLLDDWVSFARPMEVRPTRSGANATEVYDDAYFTDIIQAALEWSAIGADIGSIVQNISGIDSDGMVASALADARRKVLSEYRGQTFSARTIFAYQTLFADGPLENLVDTSRPVDALVRVFNTVQVSNALLLTVATGMRPAELDDLPRDCLAEGPVGPILKGAAFKTADEPHGDPRDWPLPSRAVEMLRRQIALADIVDPDGLYLWVDPPMGHGQDKDIPVSVRMRDTYRCLCGPDGVPFAVRGAVTVYRTRTSIARLLALSVQGGPHILYTVYGHRNIEETMGYYRARGDFEQELSETIDAVSTALGEDLISQFDDGELPARTARLVQTTLDTLSEAPSLRNGPDATGYDRLADAARILGTGVELVRPGVLCTARGTGRGACADASGLREPANCTDGCRYRFETAIALQDRKIRAEAHLAELAKLDRSDVFRYRFARDGLLAALGSFEGVLGPYRTDARVREVFSLFDEDEIYVLCENHRITFDLAMEASS
ncbi:hypothetical protein [Roseovarius sp.]|uniref:hypothetical protein n=1 Tax=Roseovarius sp. TaxID=1486281 RepID=UPI003A976F4A